MSKASPRNPFSNLVRSTFLRVSIVRKKRSTNERWRKGRYRGSEGARCWLVMGATPGDGAFPTGAVAGMAAPNDPLPQPFDSVGGLGHPAGRLGGWESNVPPWFGPGRGYVFFYQSQPGKTLASLVHWPIWLRSISQRGGWG